MSPREALEPCPEPPELVEPGQRPLDDPTLLAEAAFMRSAPFREDRVAAELTESVSMWLRVVAPVSLDTLWAPSRSADLASDGGDRVDQWEELREVVLVRSSHPASERDSIRGGDDVVLRACLRAIRRVGPGLLPPFIARTEALSTLARLQSSLSAPFRRAKRTSWSFFQTPRRCQSRSRRQQGTPEPHPISSGRKRHGRLVLSTKSMPVSASLRPMGFRPGERNRRFFGRGRKGSMICQSSSLRIASAMCASPWKGLHMVHRQIAT